MFADYVKISSLIDKSINRQNILNGSTSRKLFPLKKNCCFLPADPRLLVGGQHGDSGRALQEVGGEGRGVAEGLQRRVHVASVAHVLQAHQTWTGI